MTSSTTTAQSGATIYTQRKGLSFWQLDSAGDALKRDLNFTFPTYICVPRDRRDIKQPPLLKNERLWCGAEGDIWPSFIHGKLCVWQHIGLFSLHQCAWACWRMCWVSGKTIYLASYLDISFFFLVASDISACANDTILLTDLVSKPKKIKAFCSSICSDQLDWRPSRGSWRPASLPWLPPSIRAQKKSELTGGWLQTGSYILHCVTCGKAPRATSWLGYGVWVVGWGGIWRKHTSSMTRIGICRLQKFWGACAQVSRYWRNTRQLQRQSAYRPFMLSQGFYL